MKWLACIEAGAVRVAGDVPDSLVPSPPWMSVTRKELDELLEKYGSDPVPQAITARQARLWLVRNGVALSRVDAVIASIPDAVTRESVRVEWEYGTDVRRASQWLATLGPALGMDGDTLDQAFREAATL